MGANAQTSVPDFTAGQVLTAAQMTEVNTGIPVFADSSARDAAFGGTGEKTLAEGQYAYLESTNQTLVYDGSNWVSVGVAPGLVLVSTTTVGSAVASVTVTGAFSATYDNYRIVYNGGANSTVSSIKMSLGASTTGYYSGMRFINYVTGAGTDITDNNAAAWSYVGYGTVDSVAASFDLINPFAAKYTSYHSAGWAATTVAGVSTGIHQVSTSYTSFILAPLSGTITGGTIRVYGYANS